METERPKKNHRVRQAGRKADKKKGKDVQKSGDKHRNPKAFAIQSVKKTARRVQRNFDLQTKRQHIPVVRRLQVEPPPAIVGVVGPAKVGKSTLVRSLVRHYTKQRLNQIQGPCTMVAGKKNRLTIIECPNDLCALIDLVKVCDLIILMVDASSGFEIDQYELLTLMRTHGETKIIGVLNHLDTFKDKEKLRKTRKKIKDRYWKELHKGAKLFNLSGVNKGEYSRTEMLNLSKYILTVALKPRPIEWRLNHPYILADRMQDITDPDAIQTFKKCDRRVCLYGYVHGTNMNYNQDVHIPGCGNFSVESVQFLADPCPLPDKEKRRSLNEKERLIYAPMSSVGGVIYDKDAVYIDVGGSHSYTQRTEADEKLKSSMQELLRPAGEIEMFDENMEGEEEEDSDDTEDEKENSSEESEEASESEDEEEKEDTSLGDGDDFFQQNEEEDEDFSWKDDLTASANKAMRERQRRKPNLMKTIYGGDDKVVDEEDEMEGDDEQDVLGGFLKVITDRKEKDQRRLGINRDESKKDLADFSLDVNDEDSFVGNFRNVFGRLRDAGAEAAARLQEDDELYGDFEDLENRNSDDENGIEDGENDSDEDGEDKEDEEKDEEEEDESKTKGNEADQSIGSHEQSRKRKLANREERRIAKKQKLKEQFDKLYDNKEANSFYETWKAETTKQAEMNMTEFQDLEDDQRVQIEGFRPGMYVRLEIANMPYEFVENHEPAFPIVVGGVQSTEGNVGYVQGSFQKHKWFAKEVLKTADPLIISAGWWRFQTLPYFSKLEDNMRHRYLKYSSRDYSFCHVTFWGPLMAPKTGFVAMQTVQAVKPFRIAGIGSILALDKSVNIEKKIKLIGSVSQIFKKSAFIEGMFNHSLEVGKFQGALIKTQAGVRGHIKKGISKGPPGSFRATFEDKILKSDIVFLNAWYTVEVRQLYIPVTSLLLPVGSKSSWRGMRCVGELRHEYNLPIPEKKDSLYREVNRPVQRIPELHIPKALMKELPFKEIPKNLGPKPEQVKRVAVIRDGHEKKVSSLLTKLQTLYQHKRKVARLKMRERAQEHQKQRAKVEEKKLAKQRERKKHAYSVLGKKQQKQDFL